MRLAASIFGCVVVGAVVSVLVANSLMYSLSRLLNIQAGETYEASGVYSAMIVNVLMIYYFVVVAECGFNHFEGFYIDRFEESVDFTCEFNLIVAVFEGVPDILSAGHSSRSWRLCNFRRCILASGFAGGLLGMGLPFLGVLFRDIIWGSVTDHLDSSGEVLDGLDGAVGFPDPDSFREVDG